MMLPPFGAKENQKVQLLQFGGLDLRPKAARGTLQSMTNLSADAYPAITPRKARKKIVGTEGIVALCAPEYTGGDLTAFTGVRDGKFFYQGVMVGGTALSKGEKAIVDFHGKICIFPDKVYYQYLPDPETGQVGGRLRGMEKSLSVSGAMFYSHYNAETGDYRAYIYKNGAGFGCFKTGESLFIRGSSIQKNNTHILQGSKDFAAPDAIVSAIVESSNESSLELLLFNKKGGYETFANGTDPETVTIGVYIPDMDHVCVHNNRLWGTSKNGEYLYASKLGDCLNFQSFQGLSEDSWYAKVGTPGKFTGICSYRSAVVAFKRECIHHIYGDAPQNFSIPKQTMGGCLDGRSIAELGGVLYYLSATGFSAYSGGEPYCISPQLYGVSYTEAVAGSDGRRYYAAAYQKDGSCSVLVYDPMYGVWHKEDETPFRHFLFYGGRLYGATTEEIFCFGDGEEDIAWSLTTHPFTYDVMEQKALNALWLRLDAAAETEMTVEISQDGAAFETVATLPPRRGFGVRRLPIRFRKCESFRLRISGKGQVVLHDLELMTYQGGRNYGI